MVKLSLSLIGHFVCSLKITVAQLKEREKKGVKSLAQNLKLKQVRQHSTAAASVFSALIYSFIGIGSSGQNSIAVRWDRSGTGCLVRFSKNNMLL